MNTDTKKFFLFLIGVVLVFILVGGASYWSRSNGQSEPPALVDPSPPLDIPPDRTSPGVTPLP